MSTHLDVLKQHLIDPEVCIRCNTCEETCPVKAITHDDNNYVVNADICNFCMACISPCPTGSIDNWRNVLKSHAYSIEEQLTWGELPVQGTIATPSSSTETSAGVVVEIPQAAAPTDSAAGEANGIDVDTVRGSTVPPWSAARPYVNLYTHKAPITATCAGNYRSRTKASTTTCATSCSTSGRCRSRCSKGNQSPCSRRERRRKGERTTRGSIRSPARATANAAGTTTCR